MLQINLFYEKSWIFHMELWCIILTRSKSSSNFKMIIQCVLLIILLKKNKKLLNWIYLFTSFLKSSKKVGFWSAKKSTFNLIIAGFSDEKVDYKTKGQISPFKYNIFLYPY